MPGYLKSFAVVGAGNIGEFIIKELLTLKAKGTVSSVSILTRKSSGYEDLVSKGAKLATVDYTSQESLKSALSGIDAVISTVGSEGISLQDDIGRAAKAAGVKLFVPSEFGGPTDKSNEGVFGLKNAQRLKLQEIGLPYAVFFTGPFPDFIFALFVAKLFGFDFPAGKASILGSGTTPISFTSREDIARYVGYVLTNLPREKLENHIFRIEGDRTTFKDIASDFQARTGKKLDVTYRPRAEVEEVFKKDPKDFISFLLLEFEAGHGITGAPSELSNNEWPEWKPHKAVDAVVDIYGQ